MIIFLILLLSFVNLTVGVLAGYIIGTQRTADALKLAGVTLTKPVGP